MKVLLVSPNFYPSVGGVESHLIELMRSLPEIEFEVLTNWRRGADRSPELFPNVVFHYAWPSDRSLRSFAWGGTTVGLYRTLRALFEILRLYNRRQWLRDTGADVVHFHFLDLDQANRLARRLGLTSAIRELCKKSVQPIGRSSGMLLTDHTIFTSPWEIVPEEAKVALLETFMNIVSVDTKSFEVVRAYQTTHSGRSWFIPNSVDTEAFNEERRPHEGFRVGFAGRAGKAGEAILQAVVRELGSSVSWRFAVAGESVDVRNGIFQRLGAGVELFHNLEYLSMPKFYASLDLLFNPFPGEGVGRTSLEAMASGVPVVAVGEGDKYPIRDGETGYVLPPNPKAIAEAIVRLKNDAELVRRMRSNARSRIVSEFSNSVVFPKLRRVYSEVVEMRGP